MRLIKASAETINKVIDHRKYASDDNFNFQPAEICLLQQTKNTITNPDEKSIRWVMTFDYMHEDIYEESMRIWGKKWKYLYRFLDIRPIPGFDIDEIKISDKNYRNVMVSTIVDTEDEQIIRRDYTDINILVKGRMLTEHYTLDLNPDKLLELVQHSHIISSAWSEMIPGDGLLSRILRINDEQINNLLNNKPYFNVFERFPDKFLTVLPSNILRNLTENQIIRYIHELLYVNQNINCDTIIFNLLDYNDNPIDEIIYKAIGSFNFRNRRTIYYTSSWR